MRDTASEKLALPFEKAAALFITSFNPKSEVG